MYTQSHNYVNLISNYLQSLYLIGHNKFFLLLSSTIRSVPLMLQGVEYSMNGDIGEYIVTRIS